MTNWLDAGQEKRIDGITAVRDESNREGVRFIIEVKRDASAHVILNNLFKLTQMQTNFSFNMLAIQNGVPKILSLREILLAYIEHQKEVVTRRTIFDKEKAEARAHILAGLLIALDHIDEVIRIIRNSETDAEAGCEDVKDMGEYFEAVTDVQAFNDANDNLKEAGYKVESADISYLAQNLIKVDDEDQKSKLTKLIDTLEDNDDVQEVYSNWDD